ncbi:hypothetical protein BVI1335_1240001 [Burkholderia vietnamiensis]|nr:hypothetical protein BVI1335_1240001 [Burkholderia vietnamiensis]
MRTDALPHRGEDATRQPLPRQPTLI